MTKILKWLPLCREQECLEDHSDESAFSADCKDELDGLIAKVQGGTVFPLSHSFHRIGLMGLLQRYKGGTRLLWSHSLYCVGCQFWAVPSAECEHLCETHPGVSACMPHCLMASHTAHLVLCLPPRLVALTTAPVPPMQRVNDFRLDTVLRDACEGDLKDTCGTTLEEMDGDDKVCP